MSESSRHKSEEKPEGERQNVKPDNRKEKAFAASRN